MIHLLLHVQWHLRQGMYNIPRYLYPMIIIPSLHSISNYYAITSWYVAIRYAIPRCVIHDTTVRDLKWFFILENSFSYNGITLLPLLLLYSISVHYVKEWYTAMKFFTPLQPVYLVMCFFLLQPRLISCQCYYPNGDLSTSDDQPCSIDGGFSVCCPLNWECLSNGLCYLGNERYFGRYTCNSSYGHRIVKQRRLTWSRYG